MQDQEDSKTIQLNSINETYRANTLVEDDTQPKFVIEPADTMQFDLSDGELDKKEEGNPEDQQVLDTAIISCAKRNLCFELEYLQTVCQSLLIRASTKFDRFRQQLREIQDDPISALGGEGEQKKEEERKEILTQKIQMMENQDNGQVTFVDSTLAKNKEVKIYLEQMYSILNSMKKDYLKSESGKDRNQIKKALKAMCCHLERTRLYLDDYIYPRDLSLNLIDVLIEENHERKRAAHLTERHYSIVQKDFFTAYEKCRELDHKIQQMQGKDLEQMNQKISNESRLSVALQNDLEQLTEDQSFIDTSTIVSDNKTTRDIDELRKNFLRNTVNAIKMEAVVSMTKHFSPALFSLSKDFDEIQERTFCLQFTLKNINLTHHELQYTLYLENGTPFSLTAGYDTNKFKFGQYKDFVFINISIKEILYYNLSLLILISETKTSKSLSSTQSLLNLDSSANTHKLFKGYTVLPLYKLFWTKQLRHKQIYEVKEAMFYKPPQAFNIEDKYATLIEKRGFKKYKDQAWESKIDESIINQQNATIVNKVNFDQRDLQSSSKDKDQLKLYKSKEKYRYNDIKIDLNKISFAENTLKKSPVVRIQVAMRDNFGVVYDTVYKSMCDYQFEFMQTYESLIYQSADELNMHESFFIRIPTKSTDTLKKIYLIFMIQTLANVKDAKGVKIKTSNYQSQLENLQFKTEIFGVLPLFNAKNDSIQKNDTFVLNMRVMNELQFRDFLKFEQCQNFKVTEDKLKITIKIISNEFTHNKAINSLLSVNENSSNSLQFERIINDLKVSNTEELIIFHDKILDKLFMIITYTKSPTTQNMVFETIIQIIQLFQQDYKDYKDYLNAYIEKHFAHSKVYIPLLHQISQTSEIIKQGFFSPDQDQNNEEMIDVILATMKYLSVVFKLMKISFQEEQSCQETLPHTAEPKYNSRLADLREMGTSDNNSEEQQQYFQKSLMKFELFKKIKKSVIEEEQDGDDEDDSDDDYDNEEMGGTAGVFSKDQQRLFNDMKKSGKNHIALNDNQIGKSMKAKNSIMRKKAIRNTVQGDGLLGKLELTKREFGVFIQKSLIAIFEGCHKDSMKSTLSIRAILYENITEIFDQIIEFMDDKFLSQILLYLYEEQPYLYHHGKGQNNKKQQSRSRSKKGALSSSKLGSNSRTGDSQNSSNQAPQIQNQNPRAALPSSKSQSSAQQTINSATKQTNRKFMARGSELIEDYVTKQNFLEGLKDLNFINEEYITKHKIIAMGNILANGILDKVQGNSNKIVKAFCDNIEQYHLKRPELALHVFYFLHQLFVYLKSNDDDLPINSKSQHQQSQKLKIFSKQSLDLKDFFTKILPNLVDYTKDFYKDFNIERKLKENKVLEDNLMPFKEKTALILLSVANSCSKDKIKQYIFPEPKKITNFMQELKKLTKKMTFKEPYHVFFEKKKIQVIRKINEYVISIFMDYEDPKQIEPEYHSCINLCRQIELFLWSKLAKLNNDFTKTMRSKTMVKDQIKVQKGRMLTVFMEFWNKYKHVGQSWTNIRILNKEFNKFLKLGSDKSISIYMTIISDVICFEFENTNDILQSSNSIFSVLNELATQKDEGQFSKKFYSAFEKQIKQCEMYKNQQESGNLRFQKLVDEKLDQMRKLQEAQYNVLFSNTSLQQNTFYRVFCLAKLMEVFWELKLFQHFHDKVETFKSLHFKLENYTEIAYTDIRLLDLVRQNEDDRLQIGGKEIQGYIQIDFMKSIVEHLKKAELYEKAIEIFNQMKDIFENVVYDYEAVSQVLKQQSKIYKIMAQNQNRHYACYFKIGFYGQGFPDMIRNKDFILRGGKLMKRFDIIQQIQKHFPDTINLNDSAPPGEEIINSKNRYLQISPVFPLTFRELKDFGLDKTTKDKAELNLEQKVKDLPEKLRNYYTENFKNKFYRETVIQSKMGDELQSDIQIEIFKVKDKFPTIVNMQNILRKKKITLNALDKATRFVQEHIDNLEQLKKNVANQIYQEAGDLELLASHIRATLESPIQGGIQRYINAFVNESYLHNQNERPKVLQLFSKMEECSIILNDAIQLYEKKSEDDRIMTKMIGDYLKFKEQLNDIRNYIDELIKTSAQQQQ